MSNNVDSKPPVNLNLKFDWRDVKHRAWEDMIASTKDAIGDKAIEEGKRLSHRNSEVRAAVRATVKGFIKDYAKAPTCDVIFGKYSSSKFTRDCNGKKFWKLGRDEYDIFHRQVVSRCPRAKFCAMMQKKRNRIYQNILDKVATEPAPTLRDVYSVNIPTETIIYFVKQLDR